MLHWSEGRCLLLTAGEMLREVKEQSGCGKIIIFSYHGKRKRILSANSYKVFDLNAAEAVAGLLMWECKQCL